MISWKQLFSFSSPVFFSEMGSFWFKMIIILLLAMGFSAFGLIYCRDVNRHLYSELQGLISDSDNLHVEWGRLLLEESTWSTQSRIQRKAQGELNMIQPSESFVIKVNQ